MLKAFSKEHHFKNECKTFNLWLRAKVKGLKSYIRSKIEAGNDKQAVGISFGGR